MGKLKWKIKDKTTEKEIKGITREVMGDKFREIDDDPNKLLAYDVTHRNTSFILDKETGMVVEVLTDNFKEEYDRFTEEDEKVLYNPVNEFSLQAINDNRIITNLPINRNPQSNRELIELVTTLVAEEVMEEEIIPDLMDFEGLKLNNIVDRINKEFKGNNNNSKFKDFIINYKKSEVSDFEDEVKRVKLTSIKPVLIPQELSPDITLQEENITLMKLSEEKTAMSISDAPIKQINK